MPHEPCLLGRQPCAAEKVPADTDLSPPGRPRTGLRNRALKGPASILAGEPLFAETARNKKAQKMTLGSPDLEEGRNAYHPGGFHPVYIGDIYGGKYEIVNKIGYGRYCTVWLAKDTSKAVDPVPPDTPDDEDKYRALKVLSAEPYSEDKPIFEREILRHLRDGDRKLAGYKHVCHLVEDFEHEGPNGTHVCLVFELMGETLRSFGLWFREFMVPTSVMRKFSWHLVVTFDFAHASGVIHTDIKPDNIFAKFLDKSRMESEYLVNEVIPQQDENIQPVALRAPEVLIRAPWDAKADFWNLGAVLFEVYRAIRLFNGMVGPDNRYDLKEHLAEIVDIFGPFPKELLDRGDPDIVKEMFNKDGRVDIEDPMDRPPLESDVFLPDLDPETREVFASFLRFVMKINPADRPTPDDMVEHPWLTLTRVLKGP
ncbi:kinase-like domain-containing protein [Podospora aff. communis PSN243]|uniref:non-specific serine/threonine protein kinase n=1 Tax=Podospora aff. communis PSN243 TaxID=3040156 RepID=A0AAV9GPT6_9PEZI|nr:kinase-like domain-containing protein [Podospora aff. communis PSN243]